MHILAWVAWGMGDTCSASRAAAVWPLQILAIQGLAHRPAVWAPGHPAAGRVASTTLDSSARQLTAQLRAHHHARPPDHAISPLSCRGGWHTGNVTFRENATGERAYHPYASRGQYHHAQEQSHSRGSDYCENEWDGRSVTCKMCLQGRSLTDNSGLVKSSVKFERHVSKWFKHNLTVIPKGPERFIRNERHTLPFTQLPTCWHHPFHASGDPEWPQWHQDETRGTKPWQVKSWFYSFCHFSFEWKIPSSLLLAMFINRTLRSLQTHKKISLFNKVW